MFKGKRVDNGKWIEGYYFSSGEKRYVFTIKDLGDEFDLVSLIDSVMIYEVIPETVEQYTGLKDNSCKKL